MGSIPRAAQARTPGEDDGALRLHKQPPITMTNGRGRAAAAVPLFLRLLINIARIIKGAAVSPRTSLNSPSN